jgi:hypothetical protein
MVQITPEEVIRRRQLEQNSVDEIDGLDRMIVGDVARLDIPLRSVVSLRRVADHLRGLATMMEQASRWEDRPARSVLLEVRFQCRAVNAKLRALRGPGRPYTNRKHGSP